MKLTPPRNYRITFPLPPIALKVNARMGAHWGPKNDIKVRYQAECVKAIKEQITLTNQVMRRCEIEYRVYLGKGQRADPSDIGSWCKSLFDCLVAMAVIASDSSSCITRLDLAGVGRDWDNPRVEIIIRER